MSNQGHWEETYRSKTAGERSWSSDADTSLRVIKQYQPNTSAAIIDVGGGASPLVRRLIANGYLDVTVLDISQAALDESRSELDSIVPVRWICTDLRTWQPDAGFDVWHDRAVLHFLIDATERMRYVDLVRRAVKRDGFVVVACFAEDGPQQCSGLPVQRASHDDLVQMFGADFEVVEKFREAHQTPWGSEQPFNWLVLQRR